MSDLLSEVGKNNKAQESYTNWSEQPSAVILAMAVLIASLAEFIKALNSRVEVAEFSDNPDLVLSERDSHFFLTVMENPPEPSEGLISLFE